MNPRISRGPIVHDLTQCDLQQKLTPAENLPHKVKHVIAHANQLSTIENHDLQRKIYPLVTLSRSSPVIDILVDALDTVTRGCVLGVNRDGHNESG